MNDIKRIDIKEFREKGYLQELNRRFLHPLGLALEIVVEDGVEKLGGVIDKRDDREGFYYDIQNSDIKRKIRFIENKEFIDGELNHRNINRRQILNFDIEPIELRMNDFNNDDEKYLFSPYIKVDKDHKSLKEYHEFILNYKKQHDVCPMCGSKIIIADSIGHNLVYNRTDNYMNLKDCWCIECEYRHSTHERVSEEYFNKK